MMRTEESQSSGSKFLGKRQRQGSDIEEERSTKRMRSHIFVIDDNIWENVDARNFFFERLAMNENEEEYGTETDFVGNLNKIWDNRNLKGLSRFIDLFHLNEASSDDDWLLEIQKSMSEMVLKISSFKGFDWSDLLFNRIQFYRQPRLEDTANLKAELMDGSEWNVLLGTSYSYNTIISHDDSEKVKFLSTISFAASFLQNRSCGHNLREAGKSSFLYSNFIDRPLHLLSVLSKASCSFNNNTQWIPPCLFCVDKEYRKYCPKPDTVLFLEFRSIKIPLVFSEAARDAGDKDLLKFCMLAHCSVSTFFHLTGSNIEVYFWIPAGFTCSLFRAVRDTSRKDADTVIELLFEFQLDDKSQLELAYIVSWNLYKKLSMILDQPIPEGGPRNSNLTLYAAQIRHFPSFGSQTSAHTPESSSQRSAAGNAAQNISTVAEELASSFNIRSLSLAYIGTFGRSSLDYSTRPVVFKGTWEGKAVFIKSFPSAESESYLWVLDLEKNFKNQDLHFLESLTHFTLASGSACIVWPKVARCPLVSLNSESEFWKLCNQLIRALCFCEKNGICHGDLKPQNLGVDEHGDLVIIDWEKHIEGTPGYIAPEVLDGRFKSSWKSDLWSAGKVIQEWSSTISMSQTGRGQAKRLVTMLQEDVEHRRSGSIIVQTMESDFIPNKTPPQVLFEDEVKSMIAY
jgi:hypothetical protein